MRFDLNIPSDLAVTSYGNLRGGTHIPNKQAIDVQQLLEGSHYRALPRLAKPPPLRKLSKSKTRMSRRSYQILAMGNVLENLSLKIMRTISGF